MTVPREPVTSALLDQLRTLYLAEGLVLPIGDAAPPQRTSAQEADGRRAVLWPIPGGIVEADWARSDTGGRRTYQVDVWGKRRDQCEWVADRLRAVVLGFRAEGDGWSVVHVEVSSPGGVEAESSLWVSRERYDLLVSG